MTSAVRHPVDPDWTPPPPPPPDPPKDLAVVRLADHLEDPRPLWDLLARSGRRVHHDPDMGLHILHGHDDVKAALKGGPAWSNMLTLMPVYQPCREATDLLTQLDVPATTAAADDPDHARTREALEATFPLKRGQVAEQWGTQVDWRVDQLTTALAARRWHTVDLAADYANLLPLWVICDILGVPGHHIDQIQAWADGQIRLVWDPTIADEPAEQVRLAQGLLDFWRYTRELVDERAGSDLTDADWITRALVWRADNGGDRALTVDEVASIAFNLLVAGHETTAGLIAHTLDAALSEDGRWQHLHDHPDDIPAFVEQSLRTQPPIDAWLRLTVDDVRYGGDTIPAGSRVLCVVGANPDRELLAFGKGPHYCIGAALARMEAETAVRSLTARLPKLRLAPQHRQAFKPNLAFRAHRSLLAAVS